MINSLSLAEFRELAKRGNLIPVYAELIADAETPVSAFHKPVSYTHLTLPTNREV